MKIPKNKIQITAILGKPFYKNGTFNLNVEAIENYKKDQFTVTNNNEHFLSNVKVDDIITKP